MKNTKYPEGFEQLWNEFDGSLGSKGSKKRAYNVYKSLKVDSNDLKMLLKAVIIQKVNKHQKRTSGQFYENFQHVERWLRNERWTDEISQPDSGKLTLDERIDQAGQDYLRGRGIYPGGIHGETLEGDYETEISPPDAG